MTGLLRYESAHRIGVYAVLAALSASCGVFAPAGDCTQWADCPDDSVGTVNVDDASSESTTSDAASRSEAAGDGPAGSSPDGTVAEAEPDGLDARGEEVASETGAHDASAGCVPTGPENCTNGIDDDCNGKVDCADPACGAFLCAPAVPSGWLGPIAFWQGATGTSAPICPPSFTHVLDANSGLSASATSCSCSCTATGQVCTATGTFHPDQMCTGAACATVVPSSSGACTEVPSNSCGAGGSFSLAGLSTSGGSCAAQEISTIPPAEWTTSARLCAYDGPVDIPGGCSAGDRCMSAPTSSFRAGPCIYATGSPQAACPAGYDASAPAVFYSRFSDSRTCGACTCAGPTGGSCSGSVDLYGGSACTGTSASYPVGATCQVYSDLSPAPGSVQANYIVSPGVCTVQSHPAPVGALNPTDPVTVCCM